MRRHRLRSISAREARRALLLGAKDEDLEVDHIVPKIIGGRDHPMNYALVPAALRRQALPLAPALFTGNAFGLARGAGEARM